MVATEVVVLLHEPPAVAFARVVVPLAHIAVLPVIGATTGSALTVTE
jgi:hypothetical protein